MKTGILVAIILLIVVTPEAQAYSFGVEYDSTAGLDVNYYSARDFANRLKADGWTQTFFYGNADAWEKDWKEEAKGGWDDSYADAVDVAFWDGHGSPQGIYPDPPDDDEVRYDEAVWGDNNMEWMLAHSCSVLADDHISDWAYGTMGKGGHGLCSHSTTCNAVNAGNRMAELLVAGWTFKDAWFQQHIELQYSGCIARVIATSATANDKLWNHGGMAIPDPSPGTTWYVWEWKKP